MKNTVKKLCTLLVATLLAIYGGVATARDLTGVTVEWAPHYGTAMPDGGAMTVITKAAFERAGHNADVSFIAWNRALKNVEEGKNDFVMGAYYNEERAVTYYVSDPVYEIEFGLVALDSLGFERMDGLESLEPYTIGVVLGYANTEEFDSAEFLTKEVAPSLKLNIRKLYRERIDMVVGAFDVVRFDALQENKNAGRLTFIQPALQRNKLYLLVSRAIPDGQQIVRDFNRGLAEISADGTLDELLREYLGRE